MHSILSYIYETIQATFIRYLSNIHSMIQTEFNR